MVRGRSLCRSERSVPQNGWDGTSGDFNFHAYFVQNPSNHRLAKHVVYTEGKSLEETCDDVLRLV